MERSRLLELVRSGEGGGLTPLEQEDARAAMRLLRESGFLEDSLLEFTRRAVRVLARRGARLTLAELLREFAAAKEGEWSARSVSNFHWLSRKVVQVMGDLPLLEVTTAVLDEWFAAEFPHPTSRASAVSTLRPAFTFAKRRGYIEESPFGNMEKPRRRARAVAILTPDEVRRVMDACPADCVAAFALLTWAGIRPEELKRLRWRDVRLEEGFVHVPAAKSKTAQARNVEVLPALRAWLVRTGRHAPDAPVCPPDWHRKSQRVRSACGVEWVQQDMLRHSFGSYHLAQFRDEGRTKAAMGHSRNSETLFVHYRAAATRAAAAEFWGIGL